MSRWPHATLLLSRALEKNGKHFTAAELLSRLLSRGSEKRIHGNAGDVLEDLLDDSLSAEELSYLAYRYLGSSLHCRVLEEAASALEEEERWEELWESSRCTEGTPASRLDRGVPETRDHENRHGGVRVERDGDRFQGPNGIRQT